MTKAGCSPATSRPAGPSPRTATGRWAEEIRLIDGFADLAELSRNRPVGEVVDDDGHLLSAREYFHTYLRSLDVDRAGLPEAFKAKLATALGHIRRHQPGPLTRARSRGVPDFPGPATGLR